MKNNNTQANRYTLGLEKLKEIDDKAGEAVVESLKDIAPDLGKYIIEFSFGDIYSRKGTDLQQKEIAVVAALTAIGNAAPQLKVHTQAALNVGCSPEELVEVMIQMAGYSGFPSAINGINTLKEVLEEENLSINPVEEDENEDRFNYGAEWLSKLDKNQLSVLKENFKDSAPDLVKFTVAFGYGDVFSRKNLDPKMRQIATIAALTALGTARPQLAFHIKGGLNIGLTKEEILETILLMTVYSGFPSSINGINTAKEVFKEF
ncbi:carboxymuconolactone decarboxylase family protein [Methanobacterium aggregans]|uniref:carboxymuconolactone decarboxylase family protein n=1 Tax=Methanobacterium aggregans TaxID=1615586 RepID=UPI001AE5195D|nr:carboxymuconolactone decarboxylase family protein [Methanobacterium aggregans]MBP2045288.1 4-carboxymuconolactone decarboxylase [Methanobacterium aggregans]